MVFTTIHKFFPEEKGDRHPTLSERRNIVVMADEAHRSQYDFVDGYARHMRDALPHASFIGFTGTPIELQDANTRAVIGDYISIYDIQRAIEDRATVPIYHESRLAKLASLRKRVMRFVDKELAVLPPFQELRHLAESFGPMAIFGGLIRDLALGRAREFSSDVDVVLKDMPVDVLARHLAPHRGVRNAFGGFRVQFGRWLFDLWTFDNTWAFANGFVQGRELADLLRTTFFNWDAALFELGEDRLLVRPSYFAELEARLLAINLRPTPNELGAAIRALRFIAEGGVSVTPDLAELLYSQIRAHGIEDLATADAKRIGRRRLTKSFVGSVAIALHEHQTAHPQSRFRFFDFQPALPLPTASPATRAG